MQKKYNNIYSQKISVSSRALLLRFFEIQNIQPVDFRYSAFKDWESSVRKHLAHESSVIRLVPEN